MENIQIFKKHKTTLKETSKDNHDGTDAFMTESTLTVIDFDAVKDEYVQDFSSSRDFIASHLIETKAKKKYVKFDLERFEKLYFKHVFTYTENEFEENFVSKFSP